MSRTTYHNGIAAEEIASSHYLAHGAEVLGQRVRTAAGEIDLIVSFPDTVVFVEVKARRNHRAAAFSLSGRQAERIASAAGIWLDDTGRGALTPCRFDVALVDGQGMVEVIENAFGA